VGHRVRVVCFAQSLATSPLLWESSAGPAAHAATNLSLGQDGCQIRRGLPRRIIWRGSATTQWWITVAVCKPALILRPNPCASVAKSMFVSVAVPANVMESSSKTTVVGPTKVPPLFT
jgi:hypothetical protein